MQCFEFLYDEKAVYLRVFMFYSTFSTRACFQLDLLSDETMMISDRLKGNLEGEILEAYYWDHEDIEKYNQAAVKIATENNKYKYAVMGANSNMAASSKKMSIFKECVVSVKTALNLVVVKTMTGTAGLVSNFIDSLSLTPVLGCTYGDDTVMVITSDVEDGKIIHSKLIELLN